MQNTSANYKELVKQSGRTFKAKITCNLLDGSVVVLSDKNIMQNSLKISDATSDEGSFNIGCAIINELDFEIDNSDGKYTNMSFEGAVFNCTIGLVISQKYDGTTQIEWLKKGFYTAEEITVNEKYITVVAYDFMAKLDKDFSKVKITYPVTLAELLSEVCSYCNVAYASLEFPNSDIVIESAKYFDQSTSCRDIISYIAQLACAYMYIDMSGYLQFGWYADKNININERQKINGTVKITGVQMTDTTDNTKIYRTGTTDYCLIIDDNPLVQSSQAIQHNIWNSRLIGMTLTPFEASVLSDPSLEAGDIVTIYDLYGNSYKTPITNIIYQLDGKMTISCDAETIKEKQRSKCSQSAKVIAAAKKETQMQLSEYDVRVKQMNQLAVNAMGYYETTEQQDDGSIICYMHDKLLLADSQIIWKKTVDGIFVSTDGGKNYTAGVDKDGNAVLKILASEGIIADWIKAGNLNADLIKVGTLQGINIIATLGSIAGWQMKNGVLVSSDGTMNIDSSNNTINVNDNSGNKLMSINSYGIRFWRDSAEIGSIGIAKGADTDTYGITFNLMNGDAMTWSVYDSTNKLYINKLRYEPDSGLTVYDDLSITGDIKNGNIVDGISTDGVKPASGNFWAIKSMTTDESGHVTSIATGDVIVKNGMIVSW